MVLWQFPINAARADPDNATNHTRIMSSVYHAWSGRKVRIKIVGLCFHSNHADLAWVSTLYRLDFKNITPLERPSIESSDAGLGGAGSHGFIFSNWPGSLNAGNNATYPAANQGSGDFYFDCLLNGPVLTLDILNNAYPPGCLDSVDTPLDPMTVPFVHAVVALDVTLI